MIEQEFYLIISFFILFFNFVFQQVSQFRKVQHFFHKLFDRSFQLFFLSLLALSIR